MDTDQQRCFELIGRRSLAWLARGSVTRSVWVASRALVSATVLGRAMRLRLTEPRS